MSAKTKADDFAAMIYTAKVYHLTADHLSKFAIVDQLEYVYTIKGKSRDEVLEREVGSTFGSGHGMSWRAEVALLTRVKEVLGIAPEEALAKGEDHAESERNPQRALRVLSGSLKETLEGTARDNHLVLSIGSYWMTAIVLRALAAEIKLKSLIYKKNESLQELSDLMKLPKKPRDLHDLKFLFEKLNCVLDADTKERIRDLEIQHKIDLAKTLEKHRDDFIALRYPYEKPGITVEFPDMPKALEILDELISDELGRDGSND